MTGAPLIELRGASLGYGSTPVLTGVDLSLAPGELLGVVGPNGAGKTTLLRGLLGLLEPLAGTRSGRPRSAYVTQHEQLDSLYPLTVAELVAQGGLRPRGAWRRPRPASAPAVVAALAEVDLVAASRRPFSTLSGGQLQRALLARALVAAPELLVLDEPTSGVDPESADRILALVSRLVRDAERGAVIVSHDLPRLATHVGRIAIVRDGTVRLATARELGVDQLLAAIAPAGEPSA
ncbi:metal ABC transporter ATP-binding protein [Engelhardtia mirabilis]|uniref:High-affinity zinc uptake system ATP-binding protein ZnuC n=1 Tax=Engelhardtia mirabilis TaxID=2528011 RepID=A0A518BQC3_9BACT|nr:High-affinity zinc uptake system ATP-binding protein ZnuC [Planctomycetes bacterium Pla133]QDV03488.1 High-affinity zinc uptake system ATP-binding protein ZnuC [Planctomycetes bacterium Pla86]